MLIRLKGSLRVEGMNSVGSLKTPPRLRRRLGEGDPQAVGWVPQLGGDGPPGDTGQAPHLRAQRERCSLPTAEKRGKPLRYLPCSEEIRFFCLADLAHTNV